MAAIASDHEASLLSDEEASLLTDEGTLRENRCRKVACGCCVLCGTCCMTSVLLVVIMVVLAANRVCLGTRFGSAVGRSIHAKPLCNRMGNRTPVCDRMDWNPRRPLTCGVRAWVSQKALDHASTDFLPAFIETLSKTAIPDRNGTAILPGFTLDVHDISIRSVRAQRFELLFVTDRGLDFTIVGMAFDLEVKYMAYGNNIWNPLFSEGKLTLVLKPSTIVKGIVEFDVSEKGTPLVSLHDLLAVMDFEMSSRNTRLGWLMEVFLHRFNLDFCAEGFLGHLITSAATEFVKTHVNGIFDQLPLLAAPPPRLKQKKPLDCLAVDLSLCSISTRADHMEFQVRGALVHVGRHDVTYSNAPPLPEIHQDYIQSKMVSATMSKWVISTGLSVLQQVNGLEFTMEFATATEGLHKWLKWMWPHSNMGLQFYGKEIPSVMLDDGKIGLGAALQARLKNFGVYNCTTKGGRQCVFPFKHKGILHEMCAAGVARSRWWCATAVDNDGNYIHGQWDWCSDTCETVLLDMSTNISAAVSARITPTSPQEVEIALGQVSFQGLPITDGICKTILGQKCTFPFDYGGEKYDFCTDAGTGEGTIYSHRFWCNHCKPQDHLKRVMGACWGTCGLSCPAQQGMLLNKISKSLKAQDFSNSLALNELTQRIPVLLENASLSILHGSIRIWTDFKINVSYLHDFVQRRMNLTKKNGCKRRRARKNYSR